MDFRLCEAPAFGRLLVSEAPERWLIPKDPTVPSTEESPEADVANEGLAPIGDSNDQACQAHRQSQQR